ncbi:dihydroxy-acid dehydratase, chloroplastic [Olea europaea subsp. europaea]|uniref:Dihydroxy-acid dehydratase, chloroplastic n=1 Tax=Olea europaea subsp. europaea TaxID=158383 RepID=A0A8S0R406_OLEEU|nr:dihydroxy-acid dehydratase, chloroplastic [Olea europaea subsp. europaea]
MQVYGEYVSGSINDEERINVVRNSWPGAGACGGMYTANTMAFAIETMGMSLPYSDKVQFLVDLKPSGKYVMEDIHKVAGKITGHISAIERVGQIGNDGDFLAKMRVIQQVGVIGQQAMQKEVPFVEEKGIYKNVLQEMAQKRGLKIPSYETSPTGPHNTGFVSIVGVGSDTFQGIEPRTKKQVEANAIEVAYIALTR